MNTNQIIIIGNMVADAESRTTTGGKQVAEFRVACNRSKAGETGTADFFTCVAWEHTAEVMEQWGGKGRKVCVVGRMGSREYTNKDGIKVTVWEVKVHNVEFLGKKEDGEVQLPVPEEDDIFAE